MGKVLIFSLNKAVDNRESCIVSGDVNQKTSIGEYSRNIDQNYQGLSLWPMNAIYRNLSYEYIHT